MVSNIKHHGVEIKDKIKQTNLESYGVEHVFQNKTVKDKIKETNLKKYGVEYHTQKHLTNIIDILESSEYWNKFNSYNEIKTELKNKISNKSILNYTRKYRTDIKISSNISLPHKIINDFLDNLNISYVVNTKNVIYPVELDIFIQDYNLAIEINGTYWHTDRHNRDENYHLNKLNKCIEKDINLIHLFDIDVLHKQDIVFNLIKEKLNLNTEINVNDCNVIDLYEEDVINFINNNSLFEYVKSDIHKGLIYNNELVSIVCLKELKNTEFKYEVINQTNKLGYTIKNNVAKLISECKGKIIIFVNKNIYNDVTFENFSYVTKPYFYFTENFVKLYHSKNFDKSTLSNYDENLSVYDNIKNNKFSVIWDCGFNVFTFNNI